jgi:hypothetical protein
MCMHSCTVPIIDYECLHGHRASQLMADMVSGADTYYHVDIEEPPQCDVLAALHFMHSDQPHLDLQQCSALCYAHTAHFLHMDRLAQEVITCASLVIRRMSTAASSSPQLPSADQDQKQDYVNAAHHSTPPPSHSRSSSDSGSSGGVGSSSDIASLTPWDAIAVLTLLGDPEHVLATVSLKQWYTR